MAKMFLVINMKGPGQWPNVEENDLDAFLERNKLKREDVQIHDMPETK